MGWEFVNYLKDLSKQHMYVCVITHDNFTQQLTGGYGKLGNADFCRLKLQ